MSENIKHECGFAYIRLLKPLSYYKDKYGTVFYGLKKLHYLMAKQKNRGQDGAGISVLKLNVPYGESFLKRVRYSGSHAIDRIFHQVEKESALYPQENSEAWIKNSDFAGEVMLGHLRYATQGLNNVKFCHPFIVPDIQPSKNIALAGNFNLVNTGELLHFLGMTSQNNMGSSDLNAMIRIIHHFLLEELNKDTSSISLKEVLSKACNKFDGGYACVGQVGNGDSFVFRDKHGIRPAYFYAHEDFVVAASERIAIQTCFDVKDKITELEAGHALIVKANGEFSVERIAEPAENITPCSFERIYFSRGNDEDIYKERIQLGKNVVASVLKEINYNTENVVFSFIPNTGEIAFYGMIKGLEENLNQQIHQQLLANKTHLDASSIETLLKKRICTEKIIHKDIKARTFITDDLSRDEMVNLVYDTTHGVVDNTDKTIVLMDDSIVRGTTLKNSIIRILNRLNVKKIIIVSSAPQIRYPDCYGIDMSRLSDFIAFRAAIALLTENQKEFVIEEVYQKCIDAREKGTLHEQNFVKEVYTHFTEEEISFKISDMLRPQELSAKLTILFQTISGLHQACPQHKGDWYFTGNYPTQGGNQVANTAFINYYEGKNSRGY